MYGVYKLGNSYVSKVPALLKRDGYHLKHFHPNKWRDPLSAAVLWRDKRGREIWGVNRWDLILLHGSMAVRRLRSPIFGVAVFPAVSKHKHHNIEYPVFVVSWRDYHGEKFNETFSPTRSGTLEQAEIDANHFAARKRAQLTGGVLNVPYFSCFLAN